MDDLYDGTMHCLTVRDRTRHEQVTDRHINNQRDRTRTWTETRLTFVKSHVYGNASHRIGWLGGINMFCVSQVSGDVHHMCVGSWCDLLERYTCGR